MRYAALNTNKQRRVYWNELIQQYPKEKLRAALATIDQDSARVLRWHYVEGKSFYDIVPLLQRSISIVRNHHNRGMFQLQKYFLDQASAKI